MNRDRLIEIIKEALSITDNESINNFDNTNLFMLGLSSLNLITILVELEDNYGIDLFDDDLNPDEFSTIIKFEEKINAKLNKAE